MPMKALFLFVKALAELFEKLCVIALVFWTETISRADLRGILPIDIKTSSWCRSINLTALSMNRLRLCVVRAMSEKLPDPSHPLTEISTVSEGFSCFRATSAARF